MDNTQITLYPSNWLYNAGVIGFLKVLETNIKDIDKFFLPNDSVKIDLDLFNVKKIKSVEIPKVIEYLINYLVSDEELN
ncbi:MAG: type I-B CRISPR-associated protein Cas8b1/Cst1, partial [candidate division WOR-3 bacterium]|nr:type I-B CRISPR-associated protein Cas8b1/Cst1 [candidate division WOR-3 bacterium]